MLGPPWGCRPPAQTGPALWALGEGVRSTERDGLGWSGVGSWGPSSTTILTSLFPLPIAHRPPALALTQALMPAPRHKRSVFIFKATVAHSESAHSKAAHVTAPPAQSPSGTDANPWLETFLNMSLAQRVRFPGLLCPGRPSQDFQGCWEGEGWWGQAESGGSQLRQPSALEIWPAPLPGLPASLRGEKGLPCIQKV